LANGDSIDPAYGHFTINIVAPTELQEYSSEFDKMVRKNFLIEYPVSTMSCGEENSASKVSSLTSKDLLRRNGIVCSARRS
jgi:hypothetical protein